MQTMTQTLRTAIRQSELSLYMIAKHAGVTRPSLSMFMSGQRSLRLDLADRVAVFLGLELRPARRKGRVTHGKPQQ